MDRPFTAKEVQWKEVYLPYACYQGPPNSSKFFILTKRELPNPGAGPEVHIGHVHLTAYQGDPPMHDAPHWF